MLRFTPSFAVSVVALVAALGGTAVAAGELITRSDQVADDVIQSRHIRDGAVARADLERTYLRVRTNSKGQLLGAGNDGTVTREGVGQYLVRFPSLLPGPRGTMPIADCAVTGSARINSNPINTTTVTVYDHPVDFNAVRVFTTKPHHDVVGEFKRQDASFDLVAIC
jgi:hypothetical protein